jgi:hypothetical protein
MRAQSLRRHPHARCVTLVTWRSVLGMSWHVLLVLSTFGVHYLRSKMEERAWQELACAYLFSAQGGHIT